MATEMTASDSHLRLRLFAVSAIALFLELALIRYIGSEVRIFAYFKNLILIACFFGFGLGFFRASAELRLHTSVKVLVGTVFALWVGVHLRDIGLSAPSVAFSNFADSLTMGEEAYESEAPRTVYVAGVLWTLALFGAAIGVMFGYAQRIGRDIELFGHDRQIQAYSWNVAGSLAGILGFAACSRFSAPPYVWFAPAILATVPFLDGVRARALGVAGSAFAGLLLWSLAGPVWSPYQKLEFEPDTNVVTVNGTAYMGLLPFAGRTGNDRWRKPHLLKPGAKQVLVVGAGGGNDVAAALAAGAERVVAVEIDPAIYAIGAEHHPDSPYADPRVEVVIDDARHYGETSDEQFDLIVFSHLDSHTSLSSFTNVRLDNYIYTVESFETFSRLLKPDGGVFVSFWATRDWVPSRLAKNMSLAFGEPPLSRSQIQRRQKNHTVNQVELFATRDDGLRKWAKMQNMEAREVPVGAQPTARSTDDWPYLFVREHAVPTAMLMLALILGGVTTLGTAALIAPELRRGGGFPIERHFFFLGAAFLLVEVHNVGKLARVFGTTWSVNAWVITGVLLMILLANLVADRLRSRLPIPLLYALLLTSLLFGYFIPIEMLLGLPLASVWVSAFYTLPLFFAGLIFAESFIAAEHPARALGSNVLGSLLGGFLELLSFRVGISGLLLVAAGLYLASYPLSALPGRVGAASPEPAA